MAKKSKAPARAASKGGSKKPKLAVVGSAEHEATEAAAPSEVRKSISAPKLKSLLASARKATQNLTEISGSLGEEIKTAVDKHHLHRKAFSVIRQADRMEPEKLADFLDCLDHYLDISGLRDRAAQVQRMQFGPGGGASEPVGGDEDEDLGEGDGGFPQPRGEAAE
jgi:hypothetical protein